MKIYSNTRNIFPDISDSFSWKIQADQKVQYSVEIRHGIFNVDNDTLSEMCSSPAPDRIAKRCLVVIDENVKVFYEALIRNYFVERGITTDWLVLPGDEESKNLESTLAVIDKIAEFGLLRRSEVVLAIGGGVLMDVVGFASSLYRRGVTYIKIPTTLMGQIDAGIGVKTGVNHNQHKNRLGTYYASSSVLIDPVFLSTVEQRHITNGVSEIIKMAIIKDRELFEEVESSIQSLTPEGLSRNTVSNNKILFLSITGMLEELENNLWEKELKRLVDFGHTFSPSLEMCPSVNLLHGEAVAVDMALSLAISIKKELIGKETGDRCINLLLNANLPIHHPAMTFQLASRAINDSIQHRDGFLRMPLPTSIGKAMFVDTISDHDLNEALGYIASYQRKRQSAVA